MGKEWCVLYSTRPQYLGIANTIVQLIRRSTSGVITCGLEISLPFKLDAAGADTALGL